MALGTVCAKMGAHAYIALYSYIFALIVFYLFIHVNNRINQSNTQTRKQNFGINIFDCEGHNP